MLLQLSLQTLAYRKILKNGGDNIKENKADFLSIRNLALILRQYQRGNGSVPLLTNALASTRVSKSNFLL